MATAKNVFDLDAVRERLKACQFSSGNDHGQACACAECLTLWQGAQAAGFSRDRFILQDAPELVAEVARLQHLLHRKTTACDEWITLANERRLQLEDLGHKNLRHLNALERCLKELEQANLESVRLSTREPLAGEGGSMLDVNGKEVQVHDRVAFRSRPWDGWQSGVVRKVGMSPSSHDAEAWVDDGDPRNDDILTNGCHVAACVESCNIEILP